MECFSSQTRGNTDFQQAQQSAQWERFERMHRWRWTLDCAIVW